MNISSFEKIINEAWDIKNQIDSNSDKKLLNSINETIELLDSGKYALLKKKISNGMSING